MRRTKRHLSSAVWCRVRWWSLGLLLLLAACTSTPVLPSVTPVAGGDNHRLSWAYQHGLRGGMVARWQARCFRRQR